MQSKTLATMMACALLALGTLTQVQAADASGKWSWSQPGRQGGEPRKMTLTLKTEGEKLTGNVSSPGRDGQASVTEIQNGKVNGDEISFSVTREFQGNKLTSKYTGKVEGDTIKGKVETERDGNTRSRDWEAKRDK